MTGTNHEKAFDPAAFFSRLGLVKKIVEVEPEDTFFTQGDAADAVFCLLAGRAKISVVSAKGKQATIQLLSPGDFFGEESLGSAPGPRVTMVTAVNRCMAMKIRRDEMLLLMHEEHEFCDRFLSYLLARSQRTQADLVDQLFNTSERRLARTLLLMAEFGKPEEAQAMIPPITQETLAQMIGTTRSRVSFFMNRFRDLGLISYTDRIRVHRPQLEAALLHQFA